MNSSLTFSATQLELKIRLVDGRFNMRVCTFVPVIRAILREENVAVAIDPQ